MLWITRSHVHVDRVACPWLITRFIDSDAEFLFVPKNQIEATVKRTGGIPFDTPGVVLGHNNGKCSFEAFLANYEIIDKALHRMAQIIHTADTGDEESIDPMAAGLEAIATGYSLLFPDDFTNLEEQFTVYDALYAWCKLDVAATR